MPAIIAEYLGLPQLTHLRTVTVEDGRVTGERETDEGVLALEAPLPAIVSVHEKINEPRCPSFNEIMAAKRKKSRSSHWPTLASSLMRWAPPMPL